MLEICIQISYDQNVQLILKSYLPVVYGTTLSPFVVSLPNTLKWCAFQIVWYWTNLVKVIPETRHSH
jgi:hypothetical protein